MNDTTPTAARMMRDQWLALDPERRLVLAASMSDTARALVSASLPQGLSEHDARVRLCERLYGEAWARRYAEALGKRAATGLGKEQEAAAERDTDPRLAALRKLSPAQKLATAHQLRETAWALAAAGVRMRGPDLSENDVQDRVREIFRRALA